MYKLKSKGLRGGGGGGGGGGGCLVVLLSDIQSIFLFYCLFLLHI